MSIRVPEIAYRAYRMRGKEIAVRTRQKELYKTHILGQGPRPPGDPLIPRHRAVGSDGEEPEEGQAEQSESSDDDDPLDPLPDPEPPPLEEQGDINDDEEDELANPDSLFL